ncbi:SET domain-containing protein [Xylona heveae TC161]|uniref:SET domain-containing protein n=1 Tax=Xylona heveae (strain CBS 132557 / TC161) TaxID=1328760 RepID=A0A165FB74_XYLHT|nr:SET domain-containing protein [Xylona heveae TC161]KZF20782.1 SET domain-containing protein [Xylona heveae TC161]
MFDWIFRPRNLLGSGIIPSASINPLPTMNTTLQIFHTQNNLIMQNSTHQIMAQIYRDISDSSTPGLMLNAIDTLQKNPSLVQFISTSGKPPNNTSSLAGLLSPSIQSGILIHFYEAAAVIEKTRIWLECIQRGEETTLINELAQGAMSKATLETREYLSRTRYSEVASSCGWMMLSILATSGAFREATKLLDQTQWQAVGECIKANFRSIEVFAKVRGLRWDILLPPGLCSGSVGHIPVDHPHHWTVPLIGPARRLQYQGQLQINIDRCIYNPNAFGILGRPRNWPLQWPYPRDPTLRNFDDLCSVCCTTICACHEKPMAQPLVEITEYPHKGNGVRALERIANNAVLGEYIGEILPVHANVQDEVYGMSIFDSRRVAQVGMISSAIKGNWTRYINHSCEPNSVFETVIVGQHRKTLVKSIREIDIFEEITIDYGPFYFDSQKLCCCGSLRCRYATPERVEASRKWAERMYHARQAGR